MIAVARETAQQIPEGCQCRWANEADSTVLVRVGETPGCPVHDPPKAYPKDRCATCHAEIIWARTPRLQWMPVDAEPSPDGNVLLHWGADGLVHCRTLGTAQRFGRTDLRLSHFVGCPDSVKWRRHPPGGR